MCTWDPFILVIISPFQPLWLCPSGPCILVTPVFLWPLYPRKPYKPHDPVLVTLSMWPLYPCDHCEVWSLFDPFDPWYFWYTSTLVTPLMSRGLRGSGPPAPVTFITSIWREHKRCPMQRNSWVNIPATALNWINQGSAKLGTFCFGLVPPLLYGCTFLENKTIILMGWWRFIFNLKIHLKSAMNFMLLLIKCIKRVFWIFMSF